MKTFRLFKVFLMLAFISFSANANTNENVTGSTENPTPEATTAQACVLYNYVSTNTPIALDPSAPTITTDQITIADEISAVSMNVTLDIKHTWNADLIISLESPLGTNITILDATGICPLTAPEEDILVTLEDGAAPASCNQGAIPSISGTVAPTNPLSGFNGENAIGTWTLTIDDTYAGDGGSLDVFEMEICGILADNDGDGIQDSLDPDDDNDGTDDVSDNCPLTANADQADWDQDGIGNVCDDSTEITMVPASGFTPNGDNINDTWSIDKVNFYPNVGLQVFNRWGKEVYTSNGVYNNDWNGESTEGGSGLLPAGSYYYVIQPNNPTFLTIGVTPITGWVYINY